MRSPFGKQHIFWNIQYIECSRDACKIMNWALLNNSVTLRNNFQFCSFSMHLMKQFLTFFQPSLLNYYPSKIHLNSNVNLWTQISLILLQACNLKIKQSCATSTADEVWTEWYNPKFLPLFYVSVSKPNDSVKGIRNCFCLSTSSVICQSMTAFSQTHRLLMWEPEGISPS